MWKTWEVWTGKVADCSQQSLASLSSRSLEDDRAAIVQMLEAARPFMLPLGWSEKSNALPLPDWITDRGVDQAFSPNQARSFHLLSWTNLPPQLISDSQMIRGQRHACYIFWATDCLLTLPGGTHQSIRRQSTDSVSRTIPSLRSYMAAGGGFPRSLWQVPVFITFLVVTEYFTAQLKCGEAAFQVSVPAPSGQGKHGGRNWGSWSPCVHSQEAKSRECGAQVTAHETEPPTFKGVHPTSMNWTYKIPPRHAQGCVSRVILDPVKLMPIQNIIATNPTHEASSQMWLHTLKDPLPMTSTLETMFHVMNMKEGLNNFF